MICITPRSSGAKWSRRWTPSLVRSCARLIRLASPFRRFRPCCLPSAKHTKPHFPRRPPHLIHHTRQLPSSLRPSPLRSPCPPPRRGLFSHLTQCRPPRLNPTLSRRQSGIASSAARRTVRISLSTSMNTAVFQPRRAYSSPLLDIFRYALMKPSRSPSITPLTLPFSKPVR